MVLYLAPFIFFAGIVDSVAGGGGLITVPAYLAFGLHPSLVLGTNKLPSAIGTTVSSFNYVRHSNFDITFFIPLVVATCFGSVCGAKIVSLIDPAFIRLFLFIVIPCVTVLLQKSKRFGSNDQSSQFTAQALKKRGSAIGLGVGFYDGFFGPGTGTFFALSLTRFLHFDLLKATTYARCLNLTSNLAALVTFLWLGKVHVALGLCLAVFGIAGHYLGSRLAIKKGVRIIKPLLISVLIGLMAKVAYDFVTKDLQQFF